MSKISRDDFLKECTFRTSMSSGPGGQNVNKVETKVMLLFSIADSNLLTNEQKEIIYEKLANRINSDGELYISSTTERSQLRNKDAAIDQALQLIDKATTPTKPRVATAPTHQSVEKRLTEKRLKAERKRNRNSNFEPDL